MTALTGADELETTGPIDWIVVEYPRAKLTGEAFPLLVDLVDRGLIRIIDLLFVRKTDDGVVQAVLPEPARTQLRARDGDLDDLADPRLRAGRYRPERDCAGRESPAKERREARAQAAIPANRLPPARGRS